MKDVCVIFQRRVVQGTLQERNKGRKRGAPEMAPHGPKLDKLGCNK